MVRLAGGIQPLEGSGKGEATRASLPTLLGQARPPIDDRFLPPPLLSLLLPLPFPKQQTLKVYFLDESSVAVPVARETTAAEVCSRVAEKIGMVDAVGWSVFEVRPLPGGGGGGGSSSVSTFIRDEERLYDRVMAPARLVFRRYFPLSLSPLSPFDLRPVL